MKKIVKLIKKTLFNFFFLYTFNVLTSPLNIIIPINVLTISLMNIFGISTIFSLIVIKIINY